MPLFVSLCVAILTNTERARERPTSDPHSLTLKFFFYTQAQHQDAVLGRLPISVITHTTSQTGKSTHKYHRLRVFEGLQCMGMFPCSYICSIYTLWYKPSPSVVSIPSRRALHFSSHICPYPRFISNFGLFPFLFGRESTCRAVTSTIDGVRWDAAIHSRHTPHTRALGLGTSLMEEWS